MGLLGEFKHSSMKIILLAETLLSIYFDGVFSWLGSRTDHDECLTLQNRVRWDVAKGKQLLDDWFAQLIDEMESSQPFQQHCSSFIPILSDVWQNRLNPTGVVTSNNDFYRLKIPCFCQSGLLEPLYRFHCLRRLLELVGLLLAFSVDRFARQEVNAQLVLQRCIDRPDEYDVGAKARCRGGRDDEEYHSDHVDSLSRLFASGSVM